MTHDQRFYKLKALAVATGILAAAVVGFPKAAHAALVAKTWSGASATLSFNGQAVGSANTLVEWDDATNPKIHRVTLNVTTTAQLPADTCVTAYFDWQKASGHIDARAARVCKAGQTMQLFSNDNALTNVSNPTKIAKLAVCVERFLNGAWTRSSANCKWSQDSVQTSGLPTVNWAGNSTITENGSPEPVFCAMSAKWMNFGGTIEKRYTDSTVAWCPGEPDTYSSTPI
jgi:hypothetical protein